MGPSVATQYSVATAPAKATAIGQTAALIRSRTAASGPAMTMTVARRGGNGTGSMATVHILQISKTNKKANRNCRRPVGSAQVGLYCNRPQEADYPTATSYRDAAS